MLETIRKWFASLKAKLKVWFTSVETKYEQAKDDLEDKIRVEKREEAADEKLEKAEDRYDTVRETSGPTSIKAIDAMAEVESAQVEHEAAREDVVAVKKKRNTGKKKK